MSNIDSFKLLVPEMTNEEIEDRQIEIYEEIRDGRISVHDASVKMDVTIREQEQRAISKAIKTSNPIDVTREAGLFFRDLLKNYMQHVINIEGTSFLEKSYPGGDVLSAEEERVLKGIEEELD